MFETKFAVNIDKLEITYIWDMETRAYIEGLDYLQCGEYGEISIKRIEVYTLRASNRNKTEGSFGADMVKIK